MSEKSFPFFSGQGSTVTEADWEAMAQTWQDSGVYGNPGGSQLTIVPGATQNTIQVNPGDAAISGFHYSLTAATTLTCVPNAGGTSRADLVVLKLDREVSQITPVLLTNTALSAIPTDCIPLGVWSQLPSSMVTATNWGSATDRRWFLGARMVPAIEGADPPARAGAFLYHPVGGDDRTPVYIGAVDSGGNPFWREWRPWTRDIQIDGPWQTRTSTQDSTTSTSYTAGASPVTVTFVAPPSGKVYVNVEAQIECVTASTGFCSYEIRQNNVSGAIVQAAADAKAAIGQDQFNQMSSYRALETGLTPGSTYFVRTMLKTTNSANAVTVFTRTLLVEPVLVDGPADEVGTGGVELDGGSIIAVPEGDTSTQALVVHIPSGDRAAAPDTLAMYWNQGTAGSPDFVRTGYFNEYGELRAQPSMPGRVPFRIKGYTAQTANLTEWTDPANTEVLASVDKDGVGTFADLKVNDTPVALDYNYTPEDYGLLAWTADPGLFAGAATEPNATPGCVRLVKIKVPVATTVTNVVLSMKGSPVLTTGQNFVALYDVSTGAQLAVSADATATFNAATGNTVVPLTSPVTVPAGLVYVGFLLNGTTLPNMPRYGQTTDHPSLFLSSPRFGQFGSGLTSMPSSITIGSIAVSNWTHWAGLS